jgi:predicted  nucleic acid-binding Zn-ribbon protein
MSLARIVGLLRETQELDRQIQVKRSEGMMTLVQELEARRRKTAEQLPSTYLQIYQRIAAARGGTGFVEVQGAHCSGCFMNLPPQFLNSLRRGAEIGVCPSCGRLLGTTEKT